MFLNVGTSIIFLFSLALCVFVRKLYIIFHLSQNCKLFFYNKTAKIRPPSVSGQRNTYELKLSTVGTLGIVVSYGIVVIITVFATTYVLCQI